MTKAQYYPVALPRAVATCASPSHYGTTAAALAAALSLVLLLSAATTPLDARPADALAKSRAGAEPGPVASQLRHAGMPTDPSIDVLVVIVARKYRVSQEATREFVRTAYREGARHGIDPLLIVSVMAVTACLLPL